MDESMDKKLQKAFDELSNETNYDTGVYLGQGKLQVKEKSLDRIMPIIAERAKQVDKLFIVKSISEPDENGMANIEIGYEN